MGTLVAVHSYREKQRLFIARSGDQSLMPDPAQTPELQEMLRDWEEVQTA